MPGSVVRELGGAEGEIFAGGPAVVENCIEQLVEAGEVIGKLHMPGPMWAHCFCV